jgi:hypothetical protein
MDYKPDEQGLVIGKSDNGLRHWILNCRRRLYTMINNHPTVFEVVTGSGKKQPKAPSSNGKTKSSSKVST